jgi:hypothetical protein
MLLRSKGGDAGHIQARVILTRRAIDLRADPMRR